MCWLFFLNIKLDSPQRVDFISAVSWNSKCKQSVVRKKTKAHNNAEFKLILACSSCYRCNVKASNELDKGKKHSHRKVHYFWWLLPWKKQGLWYCSYYFLDNTLKHYPSIPMEFWRTTHIVGSHSWRQNNSKFQGCRVSMLVVLLLQDVSHVMYDLICSTDGW